VSYLHPIRITFAGRFQADVSTVNNDVRHFDNASFEPVFQEFQEGDEFNGWWNPTGSGAFRFVGCRVTGAFYEDGTTAADGANDPAIGMSISGAPARVAAKLVDLDPQWQLASAPWGLGVRASGAQGAALFSGEYASHAFRDLWFSRLPSAQADSAASSTFQSVLHDVSWNKEYLATSRILRELHEASADRLSIRLATFGFDGDPTSPDFTLGTVIGSIGVQSDGEPESFICGRRFVPASQFSSWAGISYFSAVLDSKSRQLALDLSNALTIADPLGTPADVGRLMVGILRDPAIVENTPVGPATFVRIAEIPYREPGWLAATGGVFSAALSDADLRLASECPLALVTASPYNPGASGFDAGHGIVAIRESPQGLFVGAEPIVLRIDAPGAGMVSVHAARYGAPLAQTEVQFHQVGRIPGQGGGQTDGPNTPTAAIPDIGWPEKALTIPKAAATDAAGTTSIQIGGADPGTPRTYLDGQVYLVDYRLAGQGNTDRHPFDMIAVHVRDAVSIPEHPTWDIVEPILQQYANLYPVMRGIVDMGDEASVKAQRDLLLLAFSVPMSDPNAMPATRDLSEGKRRIIVNWLHDLEASPTPPRPIRSTPSPAPGSPTGLDATSDGKTRFAAGFRNAAHQPDFPE